MYPYPSGDLHIGHWYIVTPTDALARFRRMHGYNVFFPIGFDAFGLPAENAAIKSGGHPFTWTMKNIENMRRQFRTMGATFSWKHEVVTAAPSYYRWNQWLFLRFLEAGLAYRQRCRRSTGAPTTARWRASRSRARSGAAGAAASWSRSATWTSGTSRRPRMPMSCCRSTASIGRSPSRSSRRTGSAAPRAPRSTSRPLPTTTTPGGDTIRVFTTRPDTLFGATFMVLAPEHPLVDTLTAPDRRGEVERIRAQARRRTEIDRLSTDREKTGVAIGADAINPVNGERIPIFIADYVLAGYGTGAIMAVPAHDERDFAFATQFGLPIRRVVAAPGTAADEAMSDAYIAHGADERLVNSGRFDGMSADEGGRAIVDWLASDGKAEPKVTYRLRDWLISRQRYWGTPIPIIYCERDGIVPVPFEDLPVRLPENVDYRGRGDNPLNHDEAFLYVTCPVCGELARRETDTMDTFVDSSWYWYRYLSPGKEDGPVDRALTEAWTPGRSVHRRCRARRDASAVQPLLDEGDARHRTDPDDEPFKRLFNQGQILGADGERMSKSRGNVEDPDDLVRQYGADTIRLFLMFMGPWDQGGPWSPSGIGGVYRFLNRVWTVTLDPNGREPGDPDPGRLPTGESAADAAASIRAAAHRTLRDVTEDYEGFRFNTMVAKLMELSNTLYRYRGTEVAGAREWNEAVRLLLLMLAPAAPHITEEIWSRQAAAAGREWTSIHTETWPEVDESAIKVSVREVPVQVNGKLRARVVVAADAPEEQIKAEALADPKIEAILAGRTPERIVVAGGGKLVNIVVRD